MFHSMDTEQVVNVYKHITRMPDDQDEQVTNHRRIKNRERQRRYRARKRLLADLKKAQAIGPPISNQRNLPLNDHPHDHPQQYVTRVLCRRDWKKDARRAHLLNGKEFRSRSSEIPASMMPSGGQPIPVSTGPNDAPLYSEVNIYSEKQKHVPGRRNWKAEARNKKS